jgi:plasmid maintenance system killer protein
MNAFTIPELQNQIIQIEAEKNEIIDHARNTHFMNANSKHFFCSQMELEYNQWINANWALIHELEGKS